MALPQTEIFGQVVLPNTAGVTLSSLTFRTSNPVRVSDGTANQVITGEVTVPLGEDGSIPEESPGVSLLKVVPTSVGLPANWYYHVEIKGSIGGVPKSWPAKVQVPSSPARISFGDLTWIEGNPLRAYGPDQQTLAARDAAVAAQLAAESAAAQASIAANVLAFGAVGDGVVDDTAAFQAAAATGRDVLVPYKAGGYRITAAIPITTAGQRVFAMGGRPTIRQHTQNKGVWDVQADDVTVDGFRCENPGGKVYVASSPWRGSDHGYQESSACYTWANRTTFRNMQVDGFVSGVFLSPSVAGGAYGGVHADNVVEDLVVSNVDFGIVGTGQTRARLDRVFGSYALTPGSPNAPHLVYLSEGLPNYDLWIGTIAAWDSVADGGYVLQLKAVTRGRVGSVHARTCHGVLSLLDSMELSFGSLVSIDDRSTGNGSIYMMTGTLNARHVFDDVYIQMTTDRTRSVRVAGEDCHFRSIRITTTHSISSSAADVVVVGTRNVIDLLYVVNVGASGGAAINVGNGGHILRGLRATGVTYGVTLVDPSDAIIDVDGALTTFAAGITNSGNTATGRVVQVNGASRPTVNMTRPARRRALTVDTSAQIVREDSSSYSLVALNVTTSGAFTITNPWGMAVGLAHDYEITNGTAGALGAITWGADFVVTSFTPPAAGARTTLRFVSDGAKWRQQVP